jgi:hypothetical protein
MSRMMLYPEMGTFAETATFNYCTVLDLLTKGSKLPFSVSMCHFSFPFTANKQKLPFSVSSVFCIYIYYKTEAYIYMYLYYIYMCVDVHICSLYGKQNYVYKYAAVSNAKQKPRRFA